MEGVSSIRDLYHSVTPWETLQNGEVCTFWFIGEILVMSFERGRKKKLVQKEVLIHIAAVMIIIIIFLYSQIITGPASLRRFISLCFSLA